MSRRRNIPTGLADIPARKPLIQNPLIFYPPRWIDPQTSFACPAVVVFLDIEYIYNIQKMEYQELLNELVTIIEKTKTQVISHANSSLTVMFWHVGKRILTHNLQNKRADYGKQIVVTVSRELVAKFGKNYEEKNLRRMIQFAERYPDVENIVTLSGHLSWSHFLILIPLKDQNASDFYGKLAYGNLFGVRELRIQI